MSWRRQMKALKETITQLETDNEQLRTANSPSAVGKENVELKWANEEGQKDFSRLQKSLDEATETIQRLFAENQALKALPDDPIRTEREDLKAENAGLREEINDVRMSNTHLRAENGDFQKQVKELANDYRDIKGKLIKSAECIIKLESVKSAESKRPSRTKQGK